MDPYLNDLVYLWMKLGNHLNGLKDFNRNKKFNYKGGWSIENREISFSLIQDSDIIFL